MKKSINVNSLSDQCHPQSIELILSIALPQHTIGGKGEERILLHLAFGWVGHTLQRHRRRWWDKEGRLEGWGQHRWDTEEQRMAWE